MNMRKYETPYTTLPMLPPSIQKTMIFVITKILPNLIYLRKGAKVLKQKTKLERSLVNPALHHTPVSVTQLFRASFYEPA